MTVWITTSFNKHLWDAYASSTLGSVLNNYKQDDEGFKFLFWVDNEDEQIILEQNSFKGMNVGILNKLDTWRSFEKLFSDNQPFKARKMDPENIPDGHKFRFNYMPFAKKVLSWCATYQNAEDGDLIVWLDADLEMVKKLTKDDLEAIVEDNDIVLLDRSFPWYAAETGFFVIKKNKETVEFVQQILRAYLTGFVFDMSEWHDGYVFKTLLKMSITKNTRIKDLTTFHQERDVFDNSILTQWFVHHKGGRKFGLKTAKKQSETVVMYDPEDQ